MRWHQAKALSLVQIYNVFQYAETLFSLSQFCFFYFLKSKYPSGFSLLRDLGLGSNVSWVEEPSSVTLLILHDRGCPLNYNTLFSFLTS